jgi:hypothetical protein
MFFVYADNFNIKCNSLFNSTQNLLSLPLTTLSSQQRSMLILSSHEAEITMWQLT